MTYLKPGRLALAAATLLFFLFSVRSHAALYAVDLDDIAGHDAVYDDVLDITWLADANISDTFKFGVSGISASGPASGTMSWLTANNFVAAMNADNGGAGYLGVTTWRLPGAVPLNGSAFTMGTATYDGSTDRSYQLSAPLGVYNPAGQSAGFTGSELAYHYYNNFEAIGECSGTGTNCIHYHTNEYGIDRAPDPNDYKPLFSNINNAVYWSGAAFDANEAIRFDAQWGSQGLDLKTRFSYVWVVADGNLAAASTVPVPGAAWLFGSALWALSRMHTRGNAQD